MATVYSPNIITDGLVLALDAANPKSYPGEGTTWYDKSGNGNNASLVNGPTFSNGSIVFDGANDYATITNGVLATRQKWSSYWNSSNKMTITALIKFNTTTRTGDRYGIIGNRYYYDTGYFNFHVHSNSDAQYVLAYNNGYNANFAVGISVLDRKQEWLLVSVRHNGDVSTNAVRFGVNNSFLNQSLSQAVPTGTYMSGTGYDVVIAKEQSPHWINLADIKVYNRFLSDSEILQNYNATRKRFGL